MKRSQINTIIRETQKFFDSCGFLLPPFAHWTAEDWRGKGPEVREIVDNQLGWDICDFGKEDFEHFGLTLFTVRNGNLDSADEIGAKTYAEKIMVSREEQVTEMHFHFAKTEDIINRGGGNFVIKLYNSTEGGALADSEVHVQMDGVSYAFAAGTEVVIKPGESITLPPMLYHSFWAEKGTPMALIGEVSSVNDDHTDNRFLEPQSRFPEIEEDEEPYRLLVGDYDKYYFLEGREEE